MNDKGQKVVVKFGRHCVTWRIADDELLLQHEMGVGISGRFVARMSGRDWSEIMMHENPREHERHTEARLQREIGTSPIVDVKCEVRVQAGRLRGIYMGPLDMAEVMKLSDFKVALGRKVEGDGELLIGTLNGVDCFMLKEDFE